jgi:hypothetical protein
MGNRRLHAPWMYNTFCLADFNALFGNKCLAGRNSDPLDVAIRMFNNIRL